MPKFSSAHKFSSTVSAPAFSETYGAASFVSVPALSPIATSEGTSDTLSAAAFVRGPLRSSLSAGFGILYSGFSGGTQRFYVYRPSDYGGWHDTYFVAYPGGISGGIDNYGPIEYFNGFYWQGISPSFADGKQVIRVDLASSITATAPVTLATTTAGNTAWPLHNGTTLFFVSGATVHNSSGASIGTLAIGTSAARWRYREWDTDGAGLMIVRSSSSMYSSTDGITWSPLTMPASGTSGICYNPADRHWYGVFDEDLYKSSNRGVSWTLVSSLVAIETSANVHIMPYRGMVAVHHTRDHGGGDNSNVVTLFAPGATVGVPTWMPFSVGGGYGVPMLGFCAPGRLGFMTINQGPDDMSVVSPYVVEFP
jgi:hypothetical protein